MPGTIVEAVLNSRLEHWQYAPLWVIDYLIVAAIVGAFCTAQLADQTASPAELDAICRAN